MRFGVKGIVILRAVHNLGHCLIRSLKQMLEFHKDKCAVPYFRKVFQEEFGTPNNE